jgi:hypothetical protein
MRKQIDFLIALAMSTNKQTNKQANSSMNIGVDSKIVWPLDLGRELVLCFLPFVWTDGCTPNFLALGS